MTFLKSTQVVIVFHAHYIKKNYNILYVVNITSRINLQRIEHQILVSPLNNGQNQGIKRIASDIRKTQTTININ